MFTVKLLYRLMFNYFRLEHGEKKGEQASFTHNGTLALNPAIKGDEGLYQCEANNGIGKAIEKLISLKIHGRI